MEALSQLLTQGDRFRSRRTWERCVERLPAILRGQIGSLGRSPVALMQPWAQCVCAAAIESTIQTARGGVWHKKDRSKESLTRTAAYRPS